VTHQRLTFNPEDLKVKLRFAYEWERPREWNASGFSNPDLTLWYIVRGSRRLIVNDRTYRLQPGILALVPPHTVFATEWEQEATEPIHYLAASVSAYIHGIEWSQLYGLPPYCRLETRTDAAVLCTRWKHMIDEWEQWNREGGEPDGGMFSLERATAILRVQAACKLWLAHMMQRLKPYMATPIPVVDERVQQVCAYIRSAYADEIRLENMAAAAGISEGHLRLLFRENLRCSPYRYLQQVRMEKAQDLLLSTALPLNVVAQRVGFEDYSHFLKIFRAHAGVSPSLYRKLNHPYS